MSSPVMVAGDHVSPQQQAGQSERKPGCKDPIFAVLLYVNVAGEGKVDTAANCNFYIASPFAVHCHLEAIIGIAATMGNDALTSATDGGSIYDYSGFIYAGVIISLISLVFAGFALLIVMKFPETVIKISLIFVTVLAGIWAVMAFLSGSIVGGVIGLLFFGISVWYAKAVWSRIPFAGKSYVTI